MTPVMKPRRALLAVALPFLMAASDKGGFSSADYAEGSLALLVSKRCEMSRRDTKSIEWPALVYGPGRPPAWGRKPAGACRGLDTWVLQDALAAGAFYATTDRQVIEADPNTTMFDDALSATETAPFCSLYAWSAASLASSARRCSVRRSVSQSAASFAALNFNSLFCWM